MNKPYVHSKYERIKDDDYKTIDSRCVTALVESFTIYKDSSIIDCCSPSGSGIVNRLKEIGFNAEGRDNAFEDWVSDWNIFNPPYTKKLVDEIIWKQIHGLEEERFRGIAVLVRNNFDFAKSRYNMFTHPYYVSQIHMLFRPLWVEEKKAEPIHNFVWHIWRVRSLISAPTVLYWKENK